MKVHEEAFAIRPIRIDAKNNSFVYYEWTTFPKNPRAGCEMYLRRMLLFGRDAVVENGDGNLGLDVLAENGDILQTFSISRNAFEYLRRTLKFRREPEPTSAQRGAPGAEGD